MSHKISTAESQAMISNGLAATCARLLAQAQVARRLRRQLRRAT